MRTSNATDEVEIALTYQFPGWSMDGDCQQMKKTELIGLVKELKESEKETEWYDFKREWPSNEDLLHDIICLANNTQLKDAYVLIGIDEGNEYECRDTRFDQNRKTTQQVVDFLRSKPFAGGAIPDIQVHQLQYSDEIVIDAIEIKSSKAAPYFLNTEYKGLKAGAIYTRVSDSNTPKNSTANYRQTELLWRNHFGLTDTPLEKFKAFLMNQSGWEKSLEHSMGEKEFYKQHPEYTIEHVDDDSRTASEYYHFLQTDQSPHWYEIFVRYHQTVIYGTIGTALDGGRYFSVVPERAFIHTPTHNGFSLERLAYSYGYFIEGTIEYLLHKHFYTNDYDDERIAYERFLEAIVIYKSESEKRLIESEIEGDPSSFENAISDIEPYVYIPDETREIALNSYIDSLKIVRYIQDRLEDIRNEEYRYKLHCKEQ